VPLRALRIVDGEVWVAAAPAVRDEAAHWRHRLRGGLAHNISLVIGKAVLGAAAAGVPSMGIVRDALLYGATHRERWGVGFTTLTALADILPVLDDDDRYLALFHGIAAVPMIARDSRRAPTPTLSAERSRSLRSRVGSATGSACATAQVQSARCAPRWPLAPRRNGSRLRP
jgi:hypothetical protein